MRDRYLREPPWVRNLRYVEAMRLQRENPNRTWMQIADRHAAIIDEALKRDAEAMQRLSKVSP